MNSIDLCNPCVRDISNLRTVTLRLRCSRLKNASLANYTMGNLDCETAKLFAVRQNNSTGFSFLKTKFL